MRSLTGWRHQIIDVVLRNCNGSGLHIDIEPPALAAWDVKEAVTLTGVTYSADREAGRTVNSMPENIRSPIRWVKGPKRSVWRLRYWSVVYEHRRITCARGHRCVLLSSKLELHAKLAGTLGITAHLACVTLSILYSRRARWPDPITHYRVIAIGDLNLEAALVYVFCRCAGRIAEQ